MSDRSVRASRGGMTVTVGLRDDETVVDAERDVQASLDLGQSLLADGVESWDSTYRWIGPVKFLAYKEVGPPPWRWPRVGIIRGRKKPPTLRFIAGWRSTAYALVVMWVGRRRGR